jgi:hypothetical protein
LRQFRLCRGEAEIGSAVSEGLLGTTLGFHGLGFVQIVRPDRRIGKHGNQCRLDFQHPARNIDQLVLIPVGHFQANPCPV